MPTPSPFDLSAKECHKPDQVLQTTIPGKCPRSPEDEQEKQGESRQYARAPVVGVSRSPLKGRAPQFEKH
ncbi:hypothetical protein TNCV_4871501 [Trichonephila clavipes]|nr:hypothetical protein TNCV_4871501 [Trichonephila clavipes]